MPEGPSIVILKEAVRSFIGKKIIKASGYNKNLDFGRLLGTKIIDIKTWGKHFLICLPDFTIRIHLMMFGSYRINERKPGRNSAIRLTFSKGDELNFYACSIQGIEGDINKVYDWTSDVMNPKFSAAKAIKKLKDEPTTLITDALLNQDIFSGVGNIIKNEVLFRTKVHPKSRLAKISAAKKRSIVNEAVRYSFDFLEWKPQGELKKHWEAYTKKKCPRDGHSIVKEYLGKDKRRTYYCPACQKLYQ